jgi:hypothetical protein
VTTERNRQSGKVFEDLGFEETGRDGKLIDLVFTEGKEIPDDGVVSVIDTAATPQEQVG